MVKTLSVVLAATSKQLSAGLADQQNIPYRQLLFTASGADAFIGDASVSTTSGIKVAAAGVQPVSLGPFETGPVRLSDLYAVGSGSTLQVVGVPF